MQTKALELRDAATFIAILAINIVDENPSQHWLIHRCGYDGQGVNIMVTRLDGSGKATNDPYEWGDRTFANAHHYIIENWNDLRDGDVVDIEFILGETKEPKISENPLAKRREP